MNPASIPAVHGKTPPSERRQLFAAGAAVMVSNHLAKSHMMQFTGNGGGGSDGSDGGWGELEMLLNRGAAASCVGIAGCFLPEYRMEAAKAIVSNHKNLLKDICNPSTSINIEGAPLSQVELSRVRPNLAPHVDEGLRETARRLIGRGQPPMLHPSPVAAEARAATARYLHKRIQSTPSQKPGRNPDMSERAAEAMKAVLVEVGSTLWEPLRSLMELGASENASGVAGRHSKEAREQAAKAIISNHFRLLQDICNPSETDNIDGKSLTQSELQRVHPSLAAYVDEGLRETARRLLGHGMPTALNPTNAAEDARSACARYLHARIHSTLEQKPDREPDMCPAAAKAMKAVLVEVGSSAWETLEMFLEKGAIPTCAGVASNHSKAARQEAAVAIITNHFRLIQDICNPSPTTNIDNVPLTQVELTRVHPSKAGIIEDALFETARRLLGRGQAKILADGTGQDARVACAKYLDARIHHSPEQKPGRTPDMSPEAALAMKAVLYEVANSNGRFFQPSLSFLQMKTMSLATEMETLVCDLPAISQGPSCFQAHDCRA